MKIKILVLPLILIFILSGCIQTPTTEGLEPSSIPATEPAKTEIPEKPTVPEKPLILKRNFLAGSFFNPGIIELNEVQRWQGSGSKQLSFESLNPPYVVNAIIGEATSQVAVNLEVRVYRKDDPNKIGDWPITTKNQSAQAFIIVEKGNYIIDVKSVGCAWGVFIGHESEGIRK